MITHNISFINMIFIGVYHITHTGTAFAFPSSPTKAYSDFAVFLNEDRNMVKVFKSWFCVLSKDKVWKGNPTFKKSVQSVRRYKKDSDSN